METNKNFLTPGAIVVAGVAIAIAVYATGGLNIPAQQALPAQTGNQPSGGGQAPEVTAQDYIRGNPNAKVTIVEYSDFQCPFCRQFHATMQQTLAEYGEQVRWVYRHFPIDQIHPEARPAAEASECVGEQKGSEGFWQFADAMFENQTSLGAPLYRKVAEEIGVDLVQFDACVSERKYEEKVQEQLAEGARFGVNGTPGSFINNVPVRGALPYANIKTIIDAELQKL